MTPRRTPAQWALLVAFAITVILAALYGPVD